MAKHNFNVFGVCVKCNLSETYLQAYPRECGKNVAKVKIAKKKRAARKKKEPQGFVYMPPADRFEVDRG